MKDYGNTKPAVMIKTALDLLHKPGEVFEVRIPKTRGGTWSAYFQDTAVAAALIAKENDKHHAIYMTMNPVLPSLIARSENKFSIGNPPTTTDHEIESRRWFLLDFDPVRPAGISSTDAEVADAKDRAAMVRDWLSSIGWPEPAVALSGNGYHLMYRVDLPNNDEVRVNIEFATKMLASLFSDDKVNVDTTVFNASRVWKVYGTYSKKGSHTEERPHRVAKLEYVPSQWTLVTLEQIENVARSLRDAKSDEFKDMTGEFISDMTKWLMDRGQTVVSGPKAMFGNEGQKWLISRCPFNPQHQTPMVGLVANRPVYRCLHNSCSAFRWKEFREKIDPNYKDPDTVYARLKEWCEGDSETADPELLQTACATGKKLGSIIKRLKTDGSKARVGLLEDLLKSEQRRFQKEVLGKENNEKGNIVGLIVRTKMMQQEGIVPMYWTADYDHRVRVGEVGDVDCPKLEESHEISLLVKFHSMGDSWVKQTHISQVIRHLADEYRVNPLKVHMKAFRWDGVPRLDTWLPTYFGTKDTTYTRAIGRKWLISAVARAMEPGCQADHMLILEGSQGIGKSRGLRILGGQFYVEFSGIMKGGGTGHKDMVATMLGKNIVEMSELATIKRADMESLKAILTTTVDTVRLSYERDAKDYPRTSVFSGTTNEVGQAYIFDLTGARRFWPVHAGEVRPLELERLRAERDQLWAEAVHAYESGEDWWTLPKEEVAAEQGERQMTLEQSEPWFAKVLNMLSDPNTYEAGIMHVREEYKDGQPTNEHVIRSGPMHVVLGIGLSLDMARMTANDTLRLQKVYRTIGFKKVRPSKGWMNATYAYDLTRDTVPHLWPAIMGAVNSAKNKPSQKVEQ